MHPPEANPTTPVIGIGASAGGVEALQRLVSGLPADFPAAVVVVLHVAAEGASVLASILARAGSLPAVAVTERRPLQPGVIHVAAPNRHALAEPDGTICPSAGPRENGHRPAIDPTFRSLAEVYGSRAIGVILTGTRDDGTQGLGHIKRNGGRALVQDPGESVYDAMPRSAIDHVDVDAVLPVDALATRLSDLVNATLDSTMPAPAPVAEDRGSISTRFTCPECGGVLWQHHEEYDADYRCSVGHRYSPAALEIAQAHELESALWAAARLLGDRAQLLADMSERATERGRSHSARQFADRAAVAKQRARLVQEVAQSAVRSELPADPDDETVA